MVVRAGTDRLDRLGDVRGRPLDLVGAGRQRLHRLRDLVCEPLDVADRRLQLRDDLVECLPDLPHPVVVALGVDPDGEVAVGQRRDPLAVVVGLRLQVGRQRLGLLAGGLCLLGRAFGVGDPVTESRPQRLQAVTEVPELVVTTRLDCRLQVAVFHRADPVGQPSDLANGRPFDDEPEPEQRHRHPTQQQEDVVLHLEDGREQRRRLRVRDGPPVTPADPVVVADDQLLVGRAVDPVDGVDPLSPSSAARTAGEATPSASVCWFPTASIDSLS